jgi:uncharacterized membrane protein
MLMVTEILTCLLVLVMASFIILKTLGIPHLQRSLKGWEKRIQWMVTAKQTPPQWQHPQ